MNTSKAGMRRKFRRVHTFLKDKFADVLNQA